MYDYHNARVFVSNAECRMQQHRIAHHPANSHQIIARKFKRYRAYNRYFAHTRARPAPTHTSTTLLHIINTHGHSHNSHHPHKPTLRNYDAVHSLPALCRSTLAACACSSPRRTSHARVHVPKHRQRRRCRRNRERCKQPRTHTTRCR